MEHAKRLYLVDEFDRVYKQLQRPAAAVAKTHSSIQLSKTLDDSELTLFQFSVIFTERFFKYFTEMPVTVTYWKFL